MKKSVLFFGCLIILSQVTVMAQVANPDFETWNTTIFNEPNGWYTSNPDAIRHQGVIPVTRVNGPSGYAVRMQTLVNGQDTASAYVTNTAGDPTDGEGGVPFSQMPTAITGSYRYNLPGNDTALLLVFFKKNGILISGDIFKIHGTGSQSTFTSFSFPISLPMTPDSVIIAATCSNLMTNEGVQPGSFMEIDGLAFTGCSQVIPGAQFDTWNASSVDVLDSWETSGDGLSKTTDSYTGSFAIRLTTMDYGNGDVWASNVTNGYNSENSGPMGGIPFTNAVDTLTGYYKFVTNVSDSANINIALMKNSSNVSWSGIYLPATANYTYFEIPINSGVTPDTMRIDIYSSKWPYTQNSAGSTLYIDHLVLKSTLSTGIKTNTLTKFESVAYPNPASDEIHISTAGNLNGKSLITVYNLAGQSILAEYFSANTEQFKLNISALTPGVYYYEMANGSTVSRNKFVKE